MTEASVLRIPETRTGERWLHRRLVLGSVDERGELAERMIAGALVTRGTRRGKAHERVSQLKLFAEREESKRFVGLQDEHTERILHRGEL